MSTLREKVKAASGVRTFITVNSPALGEVRLQSLFDGEWQTGVIGWFRNADYSRNIDRIKYDNVKLIQMCMVDEAGNRQFSDSVEDLELLVNLPEQITKPIFDAARDFNQPELPKNAQSAPSTTTS